MRDKVTFEREICSLMEKADIDNETKLKTKINEVIAFIKKANNLI